MVGRARDLRPAEGAEPGRPDLLLHGRPDHGQQPGRRSPRPRPHAEGRLPALQGDAGLRRAVPERLRLAGPMGRGRGREGARARFEARDRGVRAREVRPQVRRAGRVLQRGDDRAVPPPWPVDGLGQRLLHVQRHEHRVHLGLPQDGPRARLAVHGPPLDPVVPPLRDIALAARAGRRGELRRDGAPVALRPLPARGPRRRGARGLDDDAVDAAGERRRRGQAGRGLRPDRRRPLGGRRALPGGELLAHRHRCGARRARVQRPLRRARSAGRRRASRHPVGRGLARRGNGHRAHRAGRRFGGLRALEGPRPSGARPDRRGRPDAAGVRRVRGVDDGRGGGAGDARAARTGAPRRRGDDPAPLPDLLALQDAARLPRRRRLVHLGRGDPAADARRERHGRMDAAAVQETDGRLAAQHGRLEHLAQAVLRAAAPVLSVRVRTLERHRLAQGARGASGLRARPTRGAPPAVDRRRAHPLRGLRSRARAHPRGRRRVARRRHRPLLHARLAQRDVDSARLRDGRLGRPLRRGPAG